MRQAKAGNEKGLMRFILISSISKLTWLTGLCNNVEQMLDYRRLVAQ